ncbi:MAG: hypothetical protein LLF28_03195 [Nitrospiraceae bacterium]|nr:hypothetical protein [Nitrospiraceae bacterium]
MQHKRLTLTLVITVLAAILCSNSFSAQTGATSITSSSVGSSINNTSTNSKSVPSPMPSLEGLDDYHKQLAYASKNIEEGDWGMAIENLKAAEKLIKDDPRLYEMFGVVYDADRDSKKAFENYMKAGNMYFEAGDIDKSWKVLGRLRTFSINQKEADQFEKKISKKQEVINISK